MAEDDLLVTVRREHEGLVQLVVDLPDAIRSCQNGVQDRRVAAQIDGVDIGSANLVGVVSPKKRAGRNPFDSSKRGGM